MMFIPKLMLDWLVKASKIENDPLMKGALVVERLVSGSFSTHCYMVYGKRSRSGAFRRLALAA